MAIPVGDAAPVRALEGPVGNRADGQCLKALRRIGDAAGGFAEIAGVGTAGPQVLLHADPWNLARRVKVPGALYKQDVVLAAERRSPRPRRTCGAAAGSHGTDRMIEDSGARGDRGDTSRPPIAAKPGGISLSGILFSWSRTRAFCTQDGSGSTLPWDCLAV